MRPIAQKAAYLFMLVVIGTALFAQKPTGPLPSVHKAKPTTNSEPNGEVVFRNNCHRCHSAPEDLSPRITGTVLRHMRVRANLSAKDERRLLEYLAP